jgi:hypothetical protein
MIQAPIFHVNGDDPEAVVRVARLAFEYRQAFNKDVVIDLVCYRRRGHNEGDDPSMTNPQMYQIIDGKRSVRKLYTEELIGRGDISVEQAEESCATSSASWRRCSRRPATPPARRRGGAAGSRAGAAGRDRDRRRPASRRSATRTSRCPRVHPAQAGPAAAGAAGQDGGRGRHRLGLRRDPRASARCSRRASRCAWPGRTPAAARSSAHAAWSTRHRRRLPAAVRR